jgi:type IV pilus assembly protein PilQ
MTKRAELRKLAILIFVGALISGCTSFEDRRMSAEADEDKLDFSDQPESADATLSEDNSGPSAIGEDTNIEDLRYVSRQGGGTVVVETSLPATFRTRENKELNQLIVEIANAKLPDRLKRPYVTKDFGQAIASINAYQDAGSNTARVVIQFKTSTHATVTQSGRKLLIFPSATAASSEANLDDMSVISDIAQSASSGSGNQVGSTSGEDARILPNSSDAGDITRFYGKPISIEVRDMSVRDVINLISEQSGANIVISGNVDGIITLKLKQIPWDQALMIVMKSNNLGYVRQGTVLRIAPYSSLQSEAELGRKIQDAQKLAEPLRVKIIPVSYAKVADLEPRVRPFLTASRGQVVSDARTSSLIVTDTVEVLERVSNLIKALDTAPLQVLIEGKVVEAGETFARDFGIKWGLSGATTSIGSKTLSGNAFSVNAAPSFTPTISQSLKLGTFDVFGDLDATLSLAESETKVKVVSSPRIVALNNEAAEISQKVGLFVAQPSTPTATGAIPPTTYKREDLELNLKVTPQVTSGGDVLMTVGIKREFFAGERTGAPTADIQSREAKTKVMVRNGQTAVIGGIYQADMTQSETGVPWLRSVPVVGWLFKGRQYKNAKNELLLFLTPRIINAESSLPKESTLE